MILALSGPLQAGMVLDDPLNGSTTAPSTGGAQQGGTFLPGGGWRVDGPHDCIFWHVAPNTRGAFEYEVTGLGEGCSVSTKNELSHMYDWTFGNADYQYNGGYRDGPYKHFIRKQCDPGKERTCELLWQVSPCSHEPDSGALSWSSTATYRFRVEWEPVGGNTVARIYRDSTLLWQGSCPGSYTPGGLSVRIGASNRHMGEDAFIGAVYSNVRVFDSLDVVPPAAPTITKPTSGQTVTTTLPCVEWIGPSHDRYQVRISTQNNPDADPLWDSFDAISAKNYCATGPLADNATYYAFVRVGNSAGYGPWSAGRQFTVNTAHPAPNIVRIAGDSVADRNGPFLGLGATYFSGLRFYHNGVNGNTADWNKLNSELALLRDGDFKFIRILSMVAWDGKEICPVSFTNCAGHAVAAWPNYWNEFQGFLDLVATYGMRTEITIFADAQCVMPNKATRQQHVATLCTKIAGREDKIILIEMANEAWQNGFPDPGGRDELCEYATTLRACTTLPIALSSPSDMSDPGICNYYGDCPAANIATAHFSRDLSYDGWAAVIDSYRTNPCLPGIPPISSNEPIGPGSSVAEERDPIRLVMAAVFAWGANLPMYVWHSRAGIYGENERSSCPTMPGATCKLADEAAVRDFVHLDEILAPDLSSWVRNDGRETSAPFTTYCNGQPNKWWPEVGGATTGVVRNTGSIKGNSFYTYPIGIRPDGVEMEARRLVSFQVYNPLTGEIVASMTRNAGERFTLPQGPRAYIIKGVFGEVCGQDSGSSVAVDLGCPDNISGITNVQNADGDTSCVTVGGQVCRTNTDPSAGDYYAYFGVSDSWAFQGSKPNVYISVEYYDSGTHTLSLQYDAIGADFAYYYKEGGSVTLTNTNTWKSRIFHVTDAWFGNRQNAGADFRIGSVGNRFYLNRVALTTQQPLAPVITEMPQPDVAFPGKLYTRQLEVLESNPWPTFTVVEDPPDLTVSTCGLVSWTPGPEDIGEHRITVAATNSQGTVTASWVITVVSYKDFDFDGDVDQGDFGLLQRCLSGDGIGFSEDCAPADLSGDGDVDVEDFTLFWPCLAGIDQTPGC